MRFLATILGESANMVARNGVDPFHFDCPPSMFQLGQRIWKWRGVLTIAPSMAGLVIVATSVGVFQLLEWATFDQFLRLRPSEPPDPRIVVVTIDESDIHYVQRWPMPDATLAQLIRNIQGQKPQAIGVDLYRDIPVEPGHQELMAVYRSTPHLIGVEKVVKDPVAAPPILKAQDQVGLADLVLDADGRVRRALLSVTGDHDEVKLGLGIRLALIYLETQGMTLEMIDPNQMHLGLGKAVFVPFGSNDGGYVSANAGGYQILLNYRGTPKSFKQISLTDVMKNQIPPDLMRGKIVLVGATGQSLKDLFLTPYSSNLTNTPEQMPGVFVHANITSQILSAAVEGRSFIQVWPETLEWLWILVWSSLGAACSWVLLEANYHRKSIALRWIIPSTGVIIASGILIGSSYLTFLGVWGKVLWLPVVSPFVALLSSALAVAGYHSLELQRHNEKQLRESERRLHQFLEAVPVGVTVFNQRGQTCYINQRAKELLGQDITPNSLSLAGPEIYPIYLTGTHKKCSFDAAALEMQNASQKDSFHPLEIRQKNQIIPIESWGTPIFDEAGNLVYTIVAFQDITERKKAEAEREQFMQELRRVNAELEKSLDAELELTDAYGRFVPHQFLSFLGYDSITEVQLGEAVQKEMSILFADIRNFTTLSENMNPIDNFKFINAFLSRMEPAITENNGFIDKYIGDAIMALFGSSADDALNAAFSMLQRLADYNETRGRPDRPKIEIGIGINTGLSMLGTVGGQNRMEGTVISDSVNLASRIEDLTKYYGVSLLISHHTFLHLSNANDYAIRFIDQVQVKGKSERVMVYEAFDADPLEIREGKLITKTKFEEAIMRYHLQSFREAAQLFQECLTISPYDKAAQIYLERCQHYI